MEINSKGVQAKQEMTSRKAEACNFIKKEAPAQVFSSEFCETSKNTFLIEHLHYRLLLEQLSFQCVLVIISSFTE